MKQIIVLFLSSVLFLSCSEEQIVEPIIFPIDEATIGVKSKKYYPSLESNQILSIEDFEYNNLKQLQKKIYYGGNREILYNYELFNYDNNGKLNCKLDYHSNINSPTGFILLDSTAYLYIGNLLTSDKTTYPYANYFIKNNYEYDGKYLVKKTTYNNEELESYIRYEYQKNKIYKETIYSRENIFVELKEYKYKDNILSEITIYSFNNEAKRKISYSYNEGGKLMIEKVDELLDYSSSLPYVIKYEY